MIQSNDGGANISSDGGKTWSSQMNQPTAEIYGVWVDNQFPYKLYGAQQDNHDIWINPKDSQIMIQSNDGGANISSDGGKTWSSQMNQPTAEIYGIWLD